MTGARTIPVRFTLAQWDMLLAGLERAQSEWLADAQRVAPTDSAMSRLIKMQAQTLARSRQALIDAWHNQTRMENP